MTERVATIRQAVIGLGLICLASAAASPAAALTITQTLVTTFSGTPGTTSGSEPFVQFAPVLGTLTQVEVDLTYAGNHSVTATNNSGTDGTYSFELDDAVSLSVGPVTDSTTATFAPPSQSLAAGGTHTDPLSDTLSATDILTFGPDFLQFIGFGTVMAQESDTTTFTCTPTPTFPCDANVSGTLTDTVTYTYTPTSVPEPSSLLLLLGPGLAGLAGITWRRAPRN